jgi:serine/threonine-protein kinase
MNDARWAHADRLFDAALDRTPHERTAFLREACAGDEELLRAVESLLKNERDAGGFLETPAIELMAQQRDAGPAVPLTGRELAGYRVIELVGRGGMGEVYRARDSKLQRDVALKVLPPALTGDADRFARLGREARILAALNHPHIASIYGLEESDSGPALILEFVDGPTLADRLTAGALPLTEALAIARGIADALDAAHEKGIVHRDLKPANIKVRPDGFVKVLDFGLAKALDSKGSEPTTLHEAEGTKEGIILGTAPYMAPEQARGKPVDKRADIWAFGAVLYEMVTGRRAFAGDDVSSIIAAILQSEPRWDGVPAQARRLIESCLKKDPRQRLRDIGDAWTLLSEAPELTEAPSPVRSIGWTVAAALAIVAAAALWAPWRSSESATAQPLVRLDLDLGREMSLQPLLEPTFSSLVVSPDGRRLVFEGSLSGGPSRLFVRHMDDGTTRELAGTQAARQPFISPDGQWVVFHAGGKVSKVPLDGGAVVQLADLATMTGGTWDDDGNLIVGTGLPSAAGLVRIAPGGAPPTQLVQLGKGEMFLTFPQFLPGRNAVLVTTAHTPPILETNTIDVVSLADGSRKTLVRGAVSAKYLSSGHVVYANRSGVFALPVDLDKIEPRGQPVRILSDALFDRVTGGAQMDVSRAGTFVYRKNPGVRGPTPMFVRWIDASGNQVPLLEEPGLYVERPRLSPDGLSVALTVRDGADQDIYVFSPQRGSRTRLTHGGATFMSPVWTSDGRHIVFASLNNEGMSWTRADGATRPQPLVVGHTGALIPASFTPDGKRLLLNRIAGNLPQLWSVDVADDGGRLKAGQPAPWLASRATVYDGAFSPDGRWVAYQSNESGRWEVYVQPFATAATTEQGRVQFSNPGWGPVWSRNGRELFYQNVAGQVMVVGYTVKGESFVADKPRAWTVSLAGLGGFDVAPDGKRLAITLPVTTPEAPRPDHTVVLLQNFLDELRRRAPADR